MKELTENYARHSSRTSAWFKTMPTLNFTTIYNQYCSIAPKKNEPSIAAFSSESEP